uniref:PH domain-containing protein n=1 Tax=Lotharella oceanica TaxID=641309 RepID=A0A7S2TQN1_9EUKA|mmetsp:Transcript_25564/g.47666  ORF Transcript_25564/g.47666 Transcript_25564/m.47666 type:complete len:168 (+) Transcript_25564:2-505(+)
MEPKKEEKAAAPAAKRSDAPPSIFDPVIKKNQGGLASGSEKWLRLHGHMLFYSSNKEDIVGDKNIISLLKEYKANEGKSGKKRFELKNGKVKGIHVSLIHLITSSATSKGMSLVVKLHEYNRTFTFEPRDPTKPLHMKWKKAIQASAKHYKNEEEERKKEEENDELG